MSVTPPRWEGWEGGKLSIVSIAIAGPTEVSIMSAHSPASAPAPRRQGQDRVRRARAPARRRAATAATEAGILDGVRDQYGGLWIRYGTTTRATWFAVADLISDSAGVFHRLSSVGALYLTSSTQTALKQAVEAYGVNRDALVAEYPGWLEGFYVSGDGTIAAPTVDEREVIVTFEPDRRFKPRGSLREWQHAVGPFVVGQPLPYFVLGLAFVGPVLRFTPSDYLNPQAEIVGESECGKSTLGTLGASVWAGDPGSDCGGGDSWDLTINALDSVKLNRRDGFAFLDEGNLAGASLRDRKEFVLKAAFKMASTGGKRRMGDPVAKPSARFALLSTTNTALADLIEERADVCDAAQSRMITIRIAKDAPFGVFESVPRGYRSARAASEALRNAVDCNWGTAGRAFVASLVHEVEHNEANLRNTIARWLDECVNRLTDLNPSASARARKMFALVVVAARLAQRWCILPSDWGNPWHTMETVARTAFSGTASGERDALAPIQAYANQHWDELIDVQELTHPLDKAAFEDATGFLIRGDGGTDLLVPSGRFHETFPDYRALLRRLRARRLARTEGGHAPKLTIKTPRSICNEGRVYCICLGDGFR